MQVSRDLSFRKKQLKKLDSALTSYEGELYEAIYKDFKKSEFETYSTELALLHSDIKDALSNLDKWAGKNSVSTNWVNFPAKSYIIAEPLGVSLVIGAWNYPYQLSLAPAIAAIASGNTVVLKPSELPINTSHVMAELISENFDPEFFTVIEGGVPETTELLNQQFDKIFFTGSTRVGKIVYKAAAENLTPITLEMGGKSPCFIADDCKIGIAVKRLIWGKFINAGQTCIAPDYIMVHEEIEEEFIDEAIWQIKDSNYSYENENYVQIINEDNFDRLVNYINTDKVVYGGEHDKKSRYIAPTLMKDVKFTDKIMQEEIFGPILPIITYTDLNNAIEKVKDLNRPLSCYAFTSDKRKKEKISTGISYGGGAMNDTVMHISNSKLPFGGVGKSGIGIYHGKAKFETFSHYKSILDKSTLFEPSIKYSPYKEWKMKIIKWLMG